MTGEERTQPASVLDHGETFDEMWARLRHIALPCERCGRDLRGDGSRDVPLGCGACDATVCVHCGRIWAAMGPASVEHSPHGMVGHLTLGEQHRLPVAVKRRG